MSGESDRDILPGSLEGSSAFMAVAEFVEMINPQEARKELVKGVSRTALGGGWVWPSQHQL